MHWHTIWTDLFGSGAWGTGGNLVAWILCGVLAVAGAWVLKDVIGRRAAKWWDKHHGPLAVERHKQAMREHAAEHAWPSSGYPRRGLQ